MNVLEEALLIEKIQNIEVTILRILLGCVFCRIRRHIIIECLQIDNEVRDGFVRHVGQQMLDRDYVEQP